MFCFQCEQTAKGEACTKMGVCGKKPDVAALQDLLVHATKRLSVYAVAAREKGIVDDAVNRFTSEAIFSTLTNVDFDPERFVSLINDADNYTRQLMEKTGDVAGAPDFTPADSLEGLVA